MRRYEEDVDVAVVGAGPAGSVAAEAAARRGAQVVLIERKREVGTPVQCGGFLPEVSELEALLPRSEIPGSLADIPERYILARTRLQRIYSPSGDAKEFSVRGRVIDRRSFDRHLVWKAARAGAEVLVGTRADLGGGSLRLSGFSSGEVEAGAIIAADGPSSAIARGAGLADRRVAGVCLEYEMAGLDIDPDVVEMYFGTRSAPGGYAWIIPLGEDVANVGVGTIPARIRGRRLGDLLDSFIADHRIAKEKLRGGKVTAVMRGLVPAGGMPPAIQRDKVLLAGDAAGMVMATSGGGIPLAMVGGDIAGEVAARYISGNGSLAEYEGRIAKAMGRELENSVRIREVVEKMISSDLLMDGLFAILSPDQMKATMRGQIPRALERAHEMMAKR
ncbi:MAG: Digeranylgeranylglycerophospholipid reductase [Methanothrix sp.]|jgi:digeranylgeranylglycerophospholipid reductase|nr:MAG: Digeranylgeranylglycerophospholipid reductase [Methanothrix sp.]